MRHYTVEQLETEYLIYSTFNAFSVSRGMFMFQLIQAGLG